MKPMITALQRRMRTFSCRKITAAMVTNSGAEYASEIACAIGRLPIAQKPHSTEPAPTALQIGRASSRESVGQVRVDLGGGRHYKKQNNKARQQHSNTYQ